MEPLDGHEERLRSEVNRIMDNMPAYTSLADVACALYREAGYEPFPWHMDDIRDAWAQKHGGELEDAPLSDKVCMDILQRMRSGHDATIGINWDVIDYYVDEYAPQPTAYERYGPQHTLEREAGRDVEGDRS